MRNPSSLRRSAVVLLGLLAVATIGLVGVAQAGVEGQRFLFDFTGPSLESHPSVGDRYIAYIKPSTGPVQADIWRYDPATGQHAPVAANPGYGEVFPATSGDTIAYLADPNANMNYSLWARRANGTLLGEWKHTPETDIGPPSMWGDTVVFSADSSGDGNEDINYIDVTRPNQIQPLSEDALWEQSPAIWRDVAAWEIGPSTGDMEIGVQRVGEPGPPQVLTNDSLEQVGPRVWGEWVVWQELNAGQTASAVVAHNLITGEEIRVDRPGLFDGGASVFADTLFYNTFELGPTGTMRVYTHDLVSGEEHKVWESAGLRYMEPGNTTSIRGPWAAWWDIGGFDGDAHAVELQRSLDVEQLEGPDRYDTAVEISKASYAGGLDGVVVATGENFPDALAGSALAGAVGGPILITRTESLPPQVAAELSRLNPPDIYVLGGPGAVSDGVFSTIQAVVPGANVRRVAGIDRFATAREVAKECGAQLPQVTEAFVATGHNFPDALAASPVAAALGIPIYLAEGDAMSQTAIAEMQALGVQRVHMLGGPSVVTPATQQRLEAAFGAGNVMRLEGPTRYETAQAIGDWAVEDMPYLEWSGVTVATGENFPDALTGGVLAGQRGTVMLLSHTESLTPSTRAKLEEHDVYDVPRVTFFGGDGAISQAVMTGVEGALQ